MKKKMKRNMKKNMKKNLILAIIALSGTMFVAQAQTVENDTVKVKTDTTEVKKPVSKEIAYQGAVEALNRCDFVLQAHDMASVKTRATAELDSAANFLAVKGNKGLLQIAPPAEKGDSTPISGITMKMDILSCNVETDKRGNVTCMLSTLLDGTPKDFKIKLNKKNNKAVAEYEGSTFAFIGKLLPGEVADIHIGENKG